MALEEEGKPVCDEYYLGIINSIQKYQNRLKFFIFERIQILS